MSKAGESIIKGLTEALQHAEGEIDLKTTTYIVCPHCGKTKAAEENSNLCSKCHSERSGILTELTRIGQVYDI
jgi:Zn finger protein HypA/HybF involved in hydrogenase expression